MPDAVITLDEGLAVARCFGGPTTQASGFLPAVYEGTGNRTRYFCIGRDALADVLAGTRHSGSPFLPAGGADWPGPTTGTRLAKYAADAPPLALEASRKALADGDTRPADVTHLVAVSCTGFAAPGVDHALITGLGLRPTVERVNVGFMGCHGAINGLRVAGAFARDPAARVLLCAVELCSLHYHYGDDPGKVVANALFADGAAAVVNGGSTGWTLRATGSCLIPESAAAMGWTVGDHGFEMMLARAVPALIARRRAAVARRLAGVARAVGRVGGELVRPPRRAEDSGRRAGGVVAVAGRAGGQPGGVRRLRQHVVADGAVRAGPAAEPGRTAAVRHARVRPRADRRGGGVGVIQAKPTRCNGWASGHVLPRHHLDRLLFGQRRGQPGGV